MRNKTLGELKAGRIQIANKMKGGTARKNVTFFLQFRKRWNGNSRNGQWFWEIENGLFNKRPFKSLLAIILRNPLGDLLFL